MDDINDVEIPDVEICTRRTHRKLVEPLYKKEDFVTFMERKDLITGQKFKMIDGEQSMTFTLAPHYVHKIHESINDGHSRYEVLLNVWNYRTTAEWDDVFLCVEVNNIEVITPEHALPHLLYLTSYCSLKGFSINYLTISCPIPEMLNDYAFSVCIVQRYFPGEVIMTNPIRAVNAIFALVGNQIFNHGQYEFFLEFPDTGYIMKFPCRSIYCTHPEVFDLMPFLNSVQYSQQWNCPICGVSMKFEDIALDIYLKEKVDQGATYLNIYRRRVTSKLTDYNDDDIRCELELITIHD